MAQAMIMPKKYFFDNNGNPLAFGKVFTYEAGTTNPQVTWVDENKSSENSNPIILNDQGYADIYLDGSYNIEVFDQNDDPIWTADPVSSLRAPQSVDIIQDLLDLNSGGLIDGAVITVKGYNLSGDGGGGQFYWDSSATDTPNGGTIFQPTGGGNGRYFRLYSGSIFAKWFGAFGNGVSDDTAVIQNAINFATDNEISLLCPEGPYLIDALSVTCEIVGSINDRFATNTTFVSAVGAGVYAITLNGQYGALNTVTLQNTGAGNGIDCVNVSTRIGLFSVSVITTFTLVTGSGSVGVSFGQNSGGGTQAITSVFDTINVRGYDICYYMRLFSNANVYRNLYALNTTVGATISTHGFLVDGRGGIFTGCQCESNFEKSIETADSSEENTITNFWAEGTGELILNGIGNLLVNPYGFVGTTDLGALPIIVAPYSKVIKNRGPIIGPQDFTGYSRNFIENSEFPIDLGGLTWGSFVSLSGNQINGVNSIEIANPATTGSITVDHVLDYLDLDDYPWLRGKTLVYTAFGVADAGVNMSIRGIVRTSGGSNLQYGTAQVFPEGSPEPRKVIINIPEDPATAKFLVFRLFCSNVPTGGAGRAGEISQPAIFLGKELNSLEPKAPSDGANTFYGNQTFSGGDWNEAHLVFGTYHLWVAANGVLRIKDGAPTNTFDGVVVGSQI